MNLQAKWLENLLAKNMVNNLERLLAKELMKSKSKSAHLMNQVMKCRRRQKQQERRLVKRPELQLVKILDKSVEK